MKINPLGPMNNPYNKQTAPQRADKTDSPNNGRDKVEISSTAKQMQQGEIDTARQEKIDALKQKVESGTYQVDPKEAAKKFIDFWSGK
ncbi:flagellar biosynthesis anti-sigma factor FlgM [Alteribacillus sp. YIM 98480]|uniref:flagellar biosynthesis anti-sigma factor FlgM n=1 Tax=Alteribacillus sp. YIM 98480 TaxID=2606599 RepID=UPI0018EF05FB|nr:flagellar biosynthesis anti-sigma factor FlgM [Alteribacillus sp. YIM 98480]